MRKLNLAGYLAAALAVFFTLLTLTTSAHAIWAGPICVSPAPDAFLNKAFPREEASSRQTKNGCDPGYTLIYRSGTAQLTYEMRSLEDAFKGWWWREGLLVAAFLMSAYTLGRGVQNRGWNANYTRKALGAIMIVTPILLGYGAPYMANRILVALGFCAFLVSLIVFCKPLRTSFKFLETAFAAIDRPEDRPHTLTWFVTSYIASALLCMLMMWWALPTRPEFAFVALVAVSIGDLLAGVVGYRFGQHRYTTRALFTRKTYTRSIEGSACIFLTAIVAVLMVSGTLSFPQLIATLVLMPIALTIAEAKSPHTWDEPIMFLVAMVAALAIVHGVPATA